MHPVLRNAFAAAKAQGFGRRLRGIRDSAHVRFRDAGDARRGCSSIAPRSAPSDWAIAEVASRGTAVTQAAAPPDWIEVNKPFPAFAMTIPEFEPPRYAIWRHVSGSGRKDILTFGEPGGATAVVEIHRPGADDDHASEADDITASIAQLRLSDRPDVAAHDRNEVRRRLGRAVYRSGAARRAPLPALYRAASTSRVSRSAAGSAIQAWSSSLAA